MKFLSLVFACLFCVLVSCQKRNVSVNKSVRKIDTRAAKAPNHAMVKVKNERRKNFPDAAKFNAFLYSSTSDSTTGKLSMISVKIGQDIIYLDSLTLNVYKANHYKAFWSDSAKCHQVLHVINNSRFDGLTPEDYNVSALDSMFQRCFVENKKINDSLYWKLELSVTKNYLSYLNHLRLGKTDPEEIFKDWEYKRDPLLFYSSARFAKFLTQDPERLVQDFRPQYPMYNTLRTVLFAIDTIGKNSHFEWDAIPYIGKDLVAGDTSWVIIKIKDRLLSLGIGEEDPATNIFDEALMVALNYFQQHVGLTPSEAIDKPTVNKLNFTLQEIEEVVRVNMERCRWLLMREKLPDYYIIVNIADYNLRIYKNHKEVYKTKVVVGSTNKETPLFHSRMTNIEFNPQWTVPVSITTNEILPRLKNDPDYLERNNMELLKGDSVIQITDFSPYSKSYCPFVVRQKPGRSNALGQVKFIFPNPYSVYFHDTPSKAHFEKDTRAFSHGCVRIYQPLNLAAFLLAGQGMTSKQISEIIKSGKKTVIGLKTKVPVIITYWTCFTDEKNHVFFLKDIYGRDKLILKALNN